MWRQPDSSGFSARAVEGPRALLDASTKGTIVLAGAMICLSALSAVLPGRQAQAEPAATGPSSSQPQPAARTEMAWVEFSGRVVDGQTRKPIEQFMLQQGWPDRKDPAKIVWGGREESSRRPGGKFRYRAGCPKGRQIWLRVLADGYLPQPVTPKPPAAPASETNLEVHLSRGIEVRGRVLDHAGKPVKGTVFLAGNQMLTLTDGLAEHFRGSQATTGKDGRFALSGAGTGKEKIVVSTASLHVWLAPVGKLGEDVTIRLPEPAKLALAYDIEGDAKVGEFRLELKTWDMPQWRGAVMSVRKPKVPNGGEAPVEGLTPGVYDLVRMKQLRVGDTGRGVLCDRATLRLEPGRTQRADFVRKTGSPITGDVLGLKAAGAPGAFIYVKPAEANGDPYSRDEWKLRTFDAATCKVDGRFKTARIPPGSYTVIANAYKPEPQTGVVRTGWRLPDFIGTAKVTVPQAGPPPPVRIEMKPRPKRPPPRPAAKPRSATRPSPAQAQPGEPARRLFQSVRQAHAGIAARARYVRISIVGQTWLDYIPGAPSIDHQEEWLLAGPDVGRWRHWMQGRLVQESLFVRPRQLLYDLHKARGKVADLFRAEHPIPRRDFRLAPVRMEQIIRLCPLMGVKVGKDTVALTFLYARGELAANHRHIQATLDKARPHRLRQLLVTDLQGLSKEIWTYRDYHLVGQVPFPRRIVLELHVRGKALPLRVEGVPEKLQFPKAIPDSAFDLVLPAGAAIRDMRGGRTVFLKEPRSFGTTDLRGPLFPPRPREHRRGAGPRPPGRPHDMPIPKPLWVTDPPTLRAASGSAARSGLSPTSGSTA